MNVTESSLISKVQLSHVTTLTTSSSGTSSAQFTEKEESCHTKEAT